MTADKLVILSAQHQTHDGCLTSRHRM